MFKMLPCNPGRSTHSLLRTSEPWSINPPTMPTPVLIYTLRTIRPASGRQTIRLRPLIINRGSCWFYGFPEQILEICIFFIQSPNLNKPINLIPTIHPTIRPSLFVSIHSYPSLRAYCVGISAQEVEKCASFVTLLRRCLARLIRGFEVVFINDKNLYSSFIIFIFSILPTQTFWHNMYPPPPHVSPF